MFQKRDDGSKNKGKMSWNHGFIGIQMRVQRKFDPMLRTSVVNSTMQCTACLSVKRKEKEVISPKCFLVTYLFLRMLEFVGIIKWGSKEISNA